MEWPIYPQKSGSHAGPSDANFGRPHQFLVAHLIVQNTHDIQKVLKALAKGT